MPQEPEKSEKCEVGERESSVQYGGSDVYWARRK